MSIKTPDNCGAYELLISKACDGECAPEETETLKAHLRECGECRSLLAAYRETRDMMTAHLISASCPPVPSTRERGRQKYPALRPLVGRCAWQAALVAASVLFFVLGRHTGFEQANRLTAEGPSPTAVSTPSMWVADRAVGAVSMANVESEEPFTESIGRYRMAIGMELRQPKVDWMRIRELVEAMGELRTDLELLTVHMAFLDIRTGASPAEVADHWETLGTSAKAFFKP